MKSLIQSINEERISKDNIVLWNVIEIPDSGYDEEKIEKELAEKLCITEKNLIITLISAWEKKYKDDYKDYEKSLRKAAIEASKYFKSYLKLDDEVKKEAWILKKIDKIKADSKRNFEWAQKWSGKDIDDPAHNTSIRFNKQEGTKKYPNIWEPLKQNPTKLNTKNFHLYIYNDLTTRNSTSYLDWNDNYNEFAKTIIDRFPNSPKDWKEHLKYIYIYTDSKTIYSLREIKLTFGFDDEYEDKLSEKVKSFSDFMTKEYNSGKYMGD